MVTWRNIFAIMAVTLRMSSAVRLYIVHSVEEKRREEKGRGRKERRGGEERALSTFIYLQYLK